MTEVLTSLAEWRATTNQWREKGLRVGLVATMGALHAGHGSLIERAANECDRVLVTVFVNPRQFNDRSDLERYPRTLEADVELAAACGAHVVVAPTTADMWPSWPAEPATTVSVRGVAEGFEGAGRPGHFDGVASVVAKIFAINGPARAYFGEKDFQQLAVVNQMVRDLALPIEVVGCDIVRDERGLALSSRNVRLSPEGYECALSIPAALRAAQRLETPTASTVTTALVEVLQSGGVEIAYAEVVDPRDLRVLTDDDEGPARILLAGFVDGVRLLDNGPVNLQRGGF